MIVQDDLVMAGQPAKQPGEDSNRVAQRLGIGRIGDGTFHGRGIDSNLAAPFQSLEVGPLHQQPVDLLPGAGLDAADVLLEAGGTGRPAKRKTSAKAIALRVVQEERQLSVGQLLPLFEDGRAQDLLLGEPASPLTGAVGVTQIVWNQIQYRGIVVQDLGNGSSVLGRVGDRATAWKADAGFLVFDALFKPSVLRKSFGWFVLAPIDYQTTMIKPGLENAI